MINKPKIGLITITFNSSDVIDGFLSSVKKQTYKNLKLYVVDNNSADDTLDKVLLSNKSINTSVIKNDYNAGVAAGNNQGIKRALEEKCDYVMLINNDTEFEEELVEKLVVYLKEENISIVAPKMMYYDEPERIWFGGGRLNKWKGYLNEHYGFKEQDRNQFKTGMDITYAPTCCVLFQRKVFEDVGLMDEKYFVYLDDTDFFYRVMKNGEYSMKFYNETKFFHKVGSITKSIIGNKENPKFSDFRIKYMTRNSIYYFLKQANMYTYIYMGVTIIYMNIHFLLSGKYKVDINNYIKLNSYIIKGFKLYFL